MRAGSFIIACCLLTLGSCSVSKQVGRLAQTMLLNDSTLQKGFTGISLVDPVSGKKLYQHNPGKYFIPASTAKIFTLYAGMKYLGDSIPGIAWMETDSTLLIEGTGDPTLLHRKYSHQPVYDFLKGTNRKIMLCLHPWQFSAWGPGWSWDDYNDYFMTERSELPVHGNTLDITTDQQGKPVTNPSYYNNNIEAIPPGSYGKYRLQRVINSNKIRVLPAAEQFRKAEIPLFDVEGSQASLLANALDKPIGIAEIKTLPASKNILYSRPADSIFIPMMHQSDNFLAEQTLLMVSNQLLGHMNDTAVIRYLLQHDFAGMPQKPRWVDGSGLSRYNLFTTESYDYILSKLFNEFGVERMKRVLPTGGEGTLGNYFYADKGHIYAKTGSMSNQFALCGYLLTQKGKWFAFSILCNHFTGSAAPVKRSIESFLEKIISRY